MSNNFQSVKAFGKCFYIENGDRCGCQRFIALEDNERSCEACLHHSSYHEDLINDINRSNNRIPTFDTNSLSNNQGITSMGSSNTRQRISTFDELYSPYNSSNITSNTSSILNQLLTGKALDEQAIANELSSTFIRNKNHLTASTSSINMRGTRTNFDPSNYDNSNRSKRRKNVNIKIKEICITVIVLPWVGDELQTPILSQPM